ncbi:hypothetical protein Csa_018328, partial [Cucumis sativus]
MHCTLLPHHNRVSDLPPDKPVAAFRSPVIRDRVGGRKIKSVIPKQRKLVKTMIYHSLKDFLISLFRPSSDIHNRPKPISKD